MDRLALRLGLVVVIGLGSVPGSLLAQDAEIRGTVTDGFTGAVSGDATSGFTLTLEGGPIIAGQNRVFALRASGDQLTALASAVTGHYSVTVDGKLRGKTIHVTSVAKFEGVLPRAVTPAPVAPSASLPVFDVTSVKKHEGAMPLDAVPNASPTFLIGSVSGDKGSGFKLSLTGGPIFAGAPREYTLHAQGTILDDLTAAATGGYTVDVSGTTEAPAPALPAFDVTSVKKHEGVMPLDRVPNSSPTFLIGTVAGDTASGFNLTRTGGPIIAGEPRVYALRAQGVVLDELAAAATGGYTVDLNGRLDSTAPPANRTSVTGSVSGDASAGFTIERAGGPIVLGQDRTFKLAVWGDPTTRQNLEKALADSESGHYLVTVTGTLATGTISVTNVTRFSGVLPLAVTANGATGGGTDAAKTGGLINSPGLTQPQDPKR